MNYYYLIYKLESLLDDKHTEINVFADKYGYNLRKQS